MDINIQKKIVLFRLGIIILVLLFTGISFIVIFSITTRQMGSMIFSAIIGGLGACVSLFLRFSKLRNTELEFFATSWWAIVVPILVGFVMGGFLFIVFFANILTGDGGKGLFTSNLFPLFTKPDTLQDGALNLRIALKIRPESVQDFGKLLIWCFLAGYSERLVPNILDSLERRGASKDQGNGK